MVLLGAMFHVYKPRTGDFSINWFHKNKVMGQSEGNEVEWVIEYEGGNNGMEGFLGNGMGGIALRK